MAVQGLRKIDPHPGVVYRGASFTPEEFSQEVADTDVVTFSAFASASMDRGKAEDFATSRHKPIHVVYELHGSGGRDIAGISMIAAEKEVVLLPGSRYKIVSLTETSASSAPMAVAGGADVSGEQQSEQSWVVVLRPA